MNIAWDNTLSSGIEEVDVQHKEFIKLVNRLHMLQEKHSPKDLTIRILNELVKYAEYHFASEENLMFVTRYPLFEQHQLEHKKLLRALGYRASAFEDGSETLESLVSYLNAWLMSHTKDEDTKIGKYLNALSENSGA
jgi:hemerythrin